jgi:hypothetical protein
VAKSIIGGIVGTALITMMMYWVAPMMLPGPMDIAGMLSGMLGVGWSMGMIIHWINGVIIFPLVYALVLYRFLPGASWLKGAIWGLILWLIAEIVVVPMAGGGLFHAAQGGMMAAMGGLIGHLLYGIALGAVAGSPAAEPSGTYAASTG